MGFACLSKAAEFLVYTHTYAYVPDGGGTRVFPMNALQTHAGRAWALSLLLSSAVLSSAVLLLACADKKTFVPPESFHKVFLSTPEKNVVGSSVQLAVNVEGCAQVLHSQVLQRDTPIADNLPFENNTALVSLPSQAFAPFYPELGIEAQLSLKARVTCENGLVRDSLPQNVSFFPAKSADKLEERLAFMESFVAIDGAPPLPAAFLGCARPPESIGPALEYFEATGKLLQKTPLPPSQAYCNAYTHISGALQGHRWVYTPGNVDTPGNACSLFALRDNGFSRATERLALGAHFLVPNTQKCSPVAIHPGGDAFVAVAGSLQYGISRLGPRGMKGQSDAFFLRDSSTPISFAAFPTPPVVVENGEVLLVTLWTVPYASRVGQMEIIPFNIRGDKPLPLCAPGNNCPALSLGFGGNASDSTPVAVFSKDAIHLHLVQHNDFGKFFLATYMLPHLNEPSFPVGPFDNPFVKLSLSGDGHVLVASNTEETYFFSVAPSLDGRLPPLAKPLTVSRGLYVTEHTHGPDGTLSIFASPSSRGNLGWPLEVIVVDKPERGELWRFTQRGDGQTSMSAIGLSFDEGGHMWMRAGNTLIQPLRPEEYRSARTPP